MERCASPAILDLYFDRQGSALSRCCPALVAASEAAQLFPGVIYAQSLRLSVANIACRPRCKFGMQAEAEAI
jgi:hypothetical protein